MKDNSATVHVPNLQFLMTEIFKTIHDENPPFMNKIFVMEQSRYNLRYKFRSHVPRASSTKYGLETVSFGGSQIWNALPVDFKRLGNASPASNVKLRPGTGQAM